MDSTVIITCLGIIIARITDVSLGTLRTVFVVQGRRGVAWIFGFFEILIWVVVVSKVIASLTEPVYALAYALGYATGNYVGITLEGWLAFGEQMVRVFTREGPRIADQLQAEGFRVTTFHGEERDGPMQMLFITVPRKKTVDITLFAREIDPACFYIVDDVRLASPTAIALHQPTGWRAVFKKK
jgi:uncharacterized protein YebE (UPF0316 family)